MRGCRRNVSGDTLGGEDDSKFAQEVVGLIQSLFYNVFKILFLNNTVYPYNLRFGW